MDLHFSFKNFIIASIIFLIEAFIGLYSTDQFVRPYLGDVIVVLFVFYALKTIIKTSNLRLAVASLLIAYLVEWSQHLQLISRLGLQNKLWAKLILGTSFSWTDILCYTVGFLIILFVHRKNLK